MDIVINNGRSHPAPILEEDHSVFRAFPKIEIPSIVEPGPRALEVRIERLGNLPKTSWSNSKQLFVQFKPNPAAPNQKPYGTKRSTSVKAVGENWDETMLICIGDEKNPGELGFEVMEWRRFHEPAILGEVTMHSMDMAALMLQNINYELSVCLPLHHNGERVAGDLGTACLLHISFRIIVDATKKLLKYHPEVNINLQLEVEHLIETLSVKKAQLPVWRMIFLGMLSGFWMTVAGCFAFAVAGKIPFEEYLISLDLPCAPGSISVETTRSFPVLPRMVIGLLAPVAMHFIVIFGGEFYSGNCMWALEPLTAKEPANLTSGRFGRFMTVGLVKRRVNLRSFLYVLLGSLAMNILGCAVFAFLFGWATELFAEEPHLSFVRALAESKARTRPLATFLRAIPGNALICLSVHLGISARDMLGKLAALHFPLTVYTVAGYEHAIGSLVPLFLGAMYGAEVDLWRATWVNLLPALAGNFVGGAAAGMAELLLFSWDKGLGNTNQLHNHAQDERQARWQSLAAQASRSLSAGLDGLKMGSPGMRRSFRRMSESLYNFLE